MTQWLLATLNKGKQEEIASYLKPLSISFKGAESLGFQVPPETGKTFQENALIKATFYENYTHLPILADDSGLEIPALNGFPGVYTADYVKACGSYDKVFDDLKHKLKNQISEARFICVLALLDINRKATFYRGELNGHLVFPPRGQKKFGFNPIFQPKGLTQTLAEMTVEERLRLNHRGQALHKLIQDYKE